jgi:hypothetical protein
MNKNLVTLRLPVEKNGFNFTHIKIDLVYGDISRWNISVRVVPIEKTEKGEILQIFGEHSTKWAGITKIKRYNKKDIEQIITDFNNGIQSRSGTTWEYIHAEIIGMKLKLEESHERT